MAKPKGSQGKKKVKKNIPQGVAHIQATFNNTIITITDPQGNTISWASAGGQDLRDREKARLLPRRLRPKIAGKRPWSMAFEV